MKNCRNDRTAVMFRLVWMAACTSAPKRTSVHGRSCPHVAPTETSILAAATRLTLKARDFAVRPSGCTFPHSTSGVSSA